MSDMRFTCPRRVEDGTDRDDSPLSYAGSMRDTWEERAHDGRLHCNYCGSISGEEFLNYLKGGGQLGVTDKNYKAYLGDGASGKFYYQHLSVEQRHDFIDMLNAKSITFGYPGFFTVLPYFIRTAQ